MALITDDIPTGLRGDKQVFPYICRSIELTEVNPIVSYYCQLYVLEYILTNKIHTQSKENEVFTVKLLDLTEETKKSNEALADKTLSASVLLTFTLKLFNSCMESLNKLTELNKPDTISKYKATLLFFTLFKTFESDQIDYKLLSNSSAASFSEFNDLNQKKVKALKYNLSRILKNEIPYVDSVTDADLEKELEDELQKLSASNGAEEVDEVDEPEIDDFKGNNSSTNALGLPDASTKLPDFIDEPADNVSGDESSKNYFGLPGVPKNDLNDDNDIGLPGVPKNSLDEDNNIGLPGVPKFLPDDDIVPITRIVKPVDSRVEKKKETVSRNTPNRSQITKETINLIVDKNEAISKVQKHAKFAISALNYEDIETAEKELLNGLNLLRKLKEQDD